MVINSEKLLQEKHIKDVSLDDVIFNIKGDNLGLAVKTHHIIADRFKTKLDNRPGIEFPWDSVLSIPREKFIDLYEQVYKWADSLTEAESDRWVYNPCLPDKEPDISRLWRYNTAQWSIETIPLEEIGVWPRYYGVDHSLTTENVIETAKGIKKYTNGKNIDSMVTQKAINKAESMIKYADLIFQLFPIIILESGTNTRRSIENKNPEVTKMGLEYNKTGYCTDDGAGRAVVFALSGIKEVKCLVGRGLQETYPTKIEETKLLKYLS